MPKTLRAYACTAWLLASLALPAQANLPISEVPLFLRAGTIPNVLLTIDDSGSMERGYVPDSVGDSSTRRNSPLFTAASYNGLYYNPKSRYTVPTRTDGVRYSTQFTAAHVNGFDPSRGATNLSSAGYRPIYRCQPAESRSSCVDSNHSTPGTGGGSSQTVVPYTYTCRVNFDDRGDSNDRITASNCSPAMPATGAGSPGEADNSVISVQGASGSYSKNYTLASSSLVDTGVVRISLPNRSQISSDSTQSNVRLSWTETSTVTQTAGPAYYHLYYTDLPGAARPSGCNDSAETPACYVYVLVGSAQDIAAGSSEDKKQNFANWYSFYRTRALATASAAMMAVSALGENQVRLGWQTLNNGGCNSLGTTCKGYDGINRENRIRTLDALKAGATSVTHRSDFYDWVARLAIGGLTPLRSAMQRAGQYFSTRGLNGPYAQEPHLTLGQELSCRRNFHVLMTDGLWNADNNVAFGGNVDSTAQTLPDGTLYTPRYPYREPATTLPAGWSYANTLADIAFKFWSTDLTNLDNRLTPYTIDRSGTAATQYWNPRNNPATWQHMVNFTISFGLGTTLVDPGWGGSTFAGDYPLLATGSKAWPPVVENVTNAADTPEEHVYDLWHAAINSRGEFFNADDPDGIASAFQSAFNAILTKNPSSAALAANSTSFSQGALVFQARYDSADWHGQLTAISVQNSGALGNLQWDASQRMPAPSQRNITSWNGSQGFAFTSCQVGSTGMNLAQATALNRHAAGQTDNRCTDRVNWLRGQAQLGMRERPVSVLGDIISSDPVYVKDHNHGHGSAGFPESQSYPAFLQSKSSRIPMVYVGANDGMLHGFRADVGHPDSGKELMAHVPAAVYPKLSRLTDPAYAHTYYVDGGPTAADAYLGGRWRTVLVGGLGAGGSAIYAIDITDPLAHGPSKVMWEYADPQGLGLTFAQPQVGRLPNGSWVAIFGNGYNSASGEASLYVVDLATGALLKKITVDNTGLNGLSTPALFDSNGDKVIDTVYAGDLKGRLWKFDLSAASPLAWGLGNGALPLLVARNAQGQVQAITSKPAITKPSPQPAGGAMVLVGTGRYITDTDPADTTVQSFYGLWDNGAVKSLGRADLQVQTIEYEGAQFGYGVRQTSANVVDWSTRRGWYIDLVPPSVASGSPAERVVSTPIVRYDRVIFITTLPDNDACVPGGTSWLMELDFSTGARTAISVFDFNADNQFNDSDRLASGQNASGVKSNEGMLRSPAWLEGDRSSELAVKQMSGSSGGIFVVNNRKPIQPGSLRRLYWQQLR